MFASGPLRLPDLAAHHAAFPGTYPLDRITPAPLNIATARLAEVMQALSAKSGGVG